MPGAAAIHIAVRGIIVAAFISLCSGPVLAGVPAAAVPGGPGSLNGVWLKSGYRNLALASLQTPDREKVQHTSDGEWPPLQPWASEDVEKRIRRSQAGDPVPTTLTRCLPGMPSMLLGGGAYPIQIIEAPR